jgi:hypothetical protein
LGDIIELAARRRDAAQGAAKAPENGLSSPPADALDLVTAVLAHDSFDDEERWRLVGAVLQLFGENDA